MSTAHPNFLHAYLAGQYDSAQARRDVVVTWPKTRPLESYLMELGRAVKRGLQINYRVARPPRWEDAHEDHGWIGWDYGVKHPRCFMVYNGFVRGWCRIDGVCWRMEGRVLDPATGSFMRAGWYIVRDPEWHSIEPIPMRGFQGWRWFEPPNS